MPLTAAALATATSANATPSLKMLSPWTIADEPRVGALAAEDLHRRERVGRAQRRAEDEGDLPRRGRSVVGDRRPRARPWPPPGASTARAIEPALLRSSPYGRVEAVGVQQRRDEQQQHQLRVERAPPGCRGEREHRAGAEQHDRVGHAELCTTPTPAATPAASRSTIVFGDLCHGGIEGHA